MKNLLKLFALLSMLAMAGGVHAQKASKAKSAEVDIVSNPVCGECKQIIESEMLYVKGVRSVNVDVQAKRIHVEYKPRKTDLDKLRLAVTKIGYEADGLPPDQQARMALPACCQDDGHEYHD